jgi:CDP-diacylglycerol--glycerol-3-phosphate 3-phosphatidyltransferase
MVIVATLALIATFLTSYTNARAEGLGFSARVGVLQRPERITLLAAPQAFFGLALHGWVLATIVTLLMVTAWVTFFQRMAYVYRTATAAPTPTSPGE